VDSTSLITGFRITKGRASRGGGIYCSNSSVIITGNVISENSATLGGGVYCDSSRAKIFGNDIIKNSGTYGGGVYNRGGLLRLNDNEITENYAYGGHSAYGYAGGVYADSCDISIVGNNISNNTLFYSGWYPKAYGGGLYLNVCEGSMSNNLIQNNIIYGNWNYLIYSEGFGGGLCWLNSSNVTIDGNTINGNICRVPNYSTIYGAGIYMDYCFRPKILNNVVSGNSLSRSGGWVGAGMCIGNSIGIILDHLTMSGNYSGAIYLGNSSAALSNSIIANTSGNAIQWDASSTVTVGYSDFWNNSGHIVGALQGAGDVTWGWNANGVACDKYYNIFRDPFFTADTTYHLTAQSPCIDAGNPASPKDPDNTIADIGVYYFQHVPTKLQVTSSPATASVYLDTILVGKTPLLIGYISPGSHSVKLTLAGYNSWIDTIQVGAGSTANVSVELSTFTDVDDERPVSLPTEFTVAQNFPNPFNPSTTIAYELPKTMHVEIDIYNMLGQLIVTLANNQQTAGYHRVDWNGCTPDGREVSSGIYLYVIRADDQVQSRKMLLMK
jgi:hypothetical protein